MSEWGDRIRMRREERGMNQTQLAKLCGLRAPSINDWESGKTKMIDGQNLVAAARALGTSPEWIMLGSNPPPPSQSVGIDAEILADAMKLLRALGAITGDGPEASTDPKRIALAYQVILEDGGAVSDDKVIDFTARLAAKLRETADDGIDGQANQGTRRGASAGNARRERSV